ncbi:condensation domain-containing protein [Streptomyces sp. NPDC046870]|uniref:condensation domain-containing protein n=1 Tax=Streptomyces sp. NPDC046870 TaxID=3155135 RepID=UPI003455F244
MSRTPFLPLTYGQLSVWRSIEHLTEDRQHNANLLWSWGLPDGHTTEEVNRALSRLVERHASLRTCYVRSGPRGIEQVVRPATGVTAEQAELPDGADAAGGADGAGGADAVSGSDTESAWLDELGARLSGRRFDIGRDAPWRPLIVTRHSRPVRLLLCIHHLAADGAAIDLLRTELDSLLAGKDLGEPAPDCAGLAREQRSDLWAARTASAVAHWRRAADAAPPALPESRTPAPLRWGTLRSRPAAHAVRALATTARVSEHTAVLTVFLRTLAETTGERRILLGLIAGNRVDGRSRRLVSSLDQLTPLLVELDPDETFSDCAQRLHWESIRAYRNAAFDVDALDGIRRAYGYDATGRGFRYFFNYMEDMGAGGEKEEAKEEATALQAPPDDWSITTGAEGRDNGFPFYFRVGRSQELWCTLRDSTGTGDETGEGDPREPLVERTRAFLTSFHTNLLDLVSRHADGGGPAW